MKYCEIMYFKKKKAKCEGSKFAMLENKFNQIKFKVEKKIK